MGLDAVELLMEVEEEFGISIPDDEVAYFRTLGSLHDCLLEHCAGRKRVDCPTRSAFYRLRQAMGVVLDLEPRSLRPATPLLPLLAPWRRQRNWTRLERQLALKLPGLEDRAGAGVFWGVLVAATGSFLAIMAVTRQPSLALAAALLALLPGVLLGYAIGLCWTPTVGRAYHTVGGLARGLVALNDREFPVSEEPSTENDPIWDKLCDIVVQQLGVRREALRRDTRFVEDLGF